MGKSKYNKRREKQYAESAEELGGNIQQGGLENPDQYCFFWQTGSPFSQWTPSRYECNDYEYSCAEQGMMHSKALLFGDEVTAQEIMDATSPRTMKQLGQTKVRNFEEKKWKKNRERIVYEQNVAKFSQNEHLLWALMNTRDRILVEASPSDKIWGIGLHERDAVQVPANRWKGLNLLGKTLMRVRDTLAAPIRSPLETDFVALMRGIFSPEGIRNADWVLFENGTSYIIRENTEKSRDVLVNEAKEALSPFSLGAGVGTSMGDFSVSKKDQYFPNEHVYCVVYEGDVMTVLQVEEPCGDLVAGLVGRSRRTDDAKELNVIATSWDPLDGEGAEEEVLGQGAQDHSS